MRSNNTIFWGKLGYVSSVYLNFLKINKSKKVLNAEATDLKEKEKSNCP